MLFLIEKRKLLNWFSLLMFGASLVLLFLITPKLGVEFTGGYVFETSLQKEHLDQIVEKVDGIDADIVSSVAGGVAKINAEAATENIEKLKVLIGEDLLSLESIGASFGSEMVHHSIISLVSAFLVIAIYLSVRYNLIMALATLIALVHDLVISMACITVFGIEVNTMTVGALMTIVGYSINDSVVTLDKIREFVREGVSNPLEMSVKKILPRTLITSKSTLVVLVSLLAFGGESIQAFSMVLFVGVLFGTLSSLVVVVSIIEKYSERNQNVITVAKKPSEEGDL